MTWWKVVQYCRPPLSLSTWLTKARRPPRQELFPWERTGPIIGPRPDWPSIESIHRCASQLHHTDRRRGARNTTLPPTSASHAACPIAAAGTGGRPDVFYAADPTGHTTTTNAGQRTPGRERGRGQEVRQCQVAGSLQGPQQEDHRQKAGCQEDGWYVMTSKALVCVRS